MDRQGGGFGAGDLTAAQHVRLAGGGVAAPVAQVANHHRDELMIGEVVDISGSASRILLDSAAIGTLASSNDAAVAMAGQEIGRASCRERVCMYVLVQVFTVTIKKNNK